MIDHGYSKYTNDGCRCAVCREGHRLACKTRRERRREWVRAHGLPSTVRHGASAYKNWGCRCPVCTAARRWGQGR